VAEVVAAGPTGLAKARAFVVDALAELRKVTWPDQGQVRQLSIGVVVLSLFVGAVIGVMDVLFQNVLVRWLPSLFGG
jgi:preprotein translocase SecE subunit